MDREEGDPAEVEAAGGGGGYLGGVGGSGAGEGGAQRVHGERAVVAVEDRRAVLDARVVANMVTLYGGMTVQHLGGTPAAKHALSLIQRFVWADRTKESRSSHVKKYRQFAEAEGRGMPPGEVDLVCFIGYMMYEGSVSPSSFPQYLSGVRRFCEVLGMEPLPPKPTESSLLMDVLKAARRLESEMPVKEMWKRAGISAGQSMVVLQVQPQSTSWILRRRKAMWQISFCFSFRGGTMAALWPADFTFGCDFRMAIAPDVMKRTDTDRTRNPEPRPYSVPLDTPPEENPIVFIRSCIEEFRSLHGERAFIFSPSVETAGTTEFITTEIEAMAALAGIVPPTGMRFTSHSPRRGMLTEFILQHPRPDNIVIAGRMDWSPRASLTVTYFSRDVMRSEASAIYVPGALQMQLAEAL